MDKVKFSAIYASIGFTIGALLQFLLAVGLLPGNIAYGGRYDTLPTKVRLTSVVASLILFALAYFTANRGHLLGKVELNKTDKMLYWIVPVYLLINTLANLSAKTNFERYVFGFLSLSLAITTFVVARSKS